MSQLDDRGAWPAAWLIVTLGVAFAGTVAATLLIGGPFDWHIRMPEAWHGLLEASALAVAMFVALQLAPAPVALRWALLVLPAALYLRRHHVDGALLVALAYLEGLLALGAALRSGCGAVPQGWLRNLLAGIAALALVLWVGQATCLGTPRAQRTLAAVVLLPCLLWRWRHALSGRLLASAFELDSAAARAWAAVLLTIVCVSFARTNTVADFDSLWYGLRPELVLVGARSVFEPLGLASPVHYFPKLYEVLLLPLSASREYSMVQGVTIGFGGLLALLLHRLLRTLGVARVPALAGTATMWTIPAFSASTLGAKPDVFVALMVVAMIWFGGRIAAGRRNDFFWALCCAGLAISAKLIAIPYIGVAGLACLLALHRSRNAPAAAPQRDAPVVLAMCAAVGIFVCLRTWSLTGMPTIGPEQLVWLWRALGMELRLPVGTLVWINPQVWSDLPGILAGWIADLSRLSHIQITWPGNAWLWLPLLAFVAPPRSEMPPLTALQRALLWSVPLAGLALLLGVGFINPGGDGNYFIAPVALATLGGLRMAWRHCDRPRLRPALLAALAVTVALQFSYTFLSAGWGLGTRKWDGDFSRGLRETPQTNRVVLASFHLHEVEAYLRSRPRIRLTGSVDSAAGFRLPARYENVADVRFAHMDRPDDLATLQMLLGCGGVEAVLLPVAAEPPYGEVGTAFLAWAHRLPASRDRFRDAHWRIVDLGGLLPGCAPR